MSKPKKKSEATSQTKSDDELKPGKGQPTKYKPEYCDQIIEWGMHGYSKEEMCSVLKIHPDTFQEWERVHEDFSVASNEAMTHSMAWWERLGRNGIMYDTAHGRRIDAGLWARSMSARFPSKYRENATVQVNATGNNSAVEVNFANADKPKD